MAKQTIVTAEGANASEVRRRLNTAADEAFPAGWVCVSRRVTTYGHRRQADGEMLVQHMPEQDGSGGKPEKSKKAKK